MRKPSTQLWLPSLPSCSGAGSEVTEVAGEAARWSLHCGAGLGAGSSSCRGLWLLLDLKKGGKRREWTVSWVF